MTMSGPDWLDRTVRRLRLSDRNVLACMNGGARDLRQLMRRLSDDAPSVCFGTTELTRIAPGSIVILVPEGQDAQWLNINRPLFAERRLRLVLWLTREILDRVAREAGDFYDWIGAVETLEPRWPAFIGASLRAALMDGGGVVVAPSLVSHLSEFGVEPATVDAHDPEAVLREAFSAPGGRPVLVSGVDDPRWWWRARFARAASRGGGPWLLTASGFVPPGTWGIEGEAQPWGKTTETLAAAGFEKPALWAAAVECEPDAVGLLRRLPVSERTHTRLGALLAAEDPGAMLAEAVFDADADPLRDLVLRRAPLPCLRASRRVTPEIAERRNTLSPESATTEERAAAWVVFGEHAEARPDEVPADNTDGSLAAYCEAAVRSFQGPPETRAPAAAGNLGTLTGLVRRTIHQFAGQRGDETESEKARAAFVLSQVLETLGFIDEAAELRSAVWSWVRAGEGDWATVRDLSGVAIAMARFESFFGGAAKQDALTILSAGAALGASLSVGDEGSARVLLDGLAAEARALGEAGRLWPARIALAEYEYIARRLGNLGPHVSIAGRHARVILELARGQRGAARAAATGDTPIPAPEAANALSSARALAHRAAIERELGQLEESVTTGTEAIRALERVLGTALHPEVANARMVLAETLGALGRIAHASEALDSAEAAFRACVPRAPRPAIRVRALRHRLEGPGGTSVQGGQGNFVFRLGYRAALSPLVDALHRGLTVRPVRVFAVVVPTDSDADCKDVVDALEYRLSQRLPAGTILEVVSGQDGAGRPRAPALSRLRDRIRGKHRIIIRDDTELTFGNPRGARAWLEACREIRPPGGTVVIALACAPLEMADTLRALTAERSPPGFEVCPTVPLGPIRQETVAATLLDDLGPTCPLPMVSELANLVAEAAGGDRRTAAALLDRGAREGWARLLGDLQSKGALARG